MLAVTLACFGCQSRARRVEIYSVEGTLLIDGKPASRACVYFHPHVPLDGANPIPFAIVESNGTFRPSTYSQRDGLPAGEYTVTVVWPRFVEFDGQEIATDDRLRGKYANPQSPVRTVTIEAGENKLPTIELES
jgi:hypothetical protein